MMYDDDEIDLEDLEARLYSQVYHVSAEEEPMTTSITIESARNVTTYSINNTRRPRYFQNDTSKKFMTAPISASYQSTIPNANTNENYINLSPNTIQNNITVNQYSFPQLVLDPETLCLTHSNKNKEKYEQRKRARELKRETRKAKRKANQKKKRELRKLQEDASQYAHDMQNVYSNEVEAFQQQGTQYVAVKSEAPRLVVPQIRSHIIYLSDSDDCVEVTPRPKYFENKDSQNITNDGNSGNEDDVILIEPPPIEVINLDPEISKSCDIPQEDRKTKEIPDNEPKESNDIPPTDIRNISYTPSERKELLSTPESSASNDFLENSGVDLDRNTFNMSLHDSDFHNGDFVKPANPRDVYETESSCSTSEYVRDFNNSVKTIVFNEVDFPREDIFNENNLESFGNLITPKRTTPSNNKSTERKTNLEAIQKGHTQESDSDSSTESEYELPMENINLQNKLLINHSLDKTLPTLSPIQSDGEIISSLKKNKIQPTLNDNSKKLKSNVEEVEATPPDTSFSDVVNETIGDVTAKSDLATEECESENDSDISAQQKSDMNESESEKYLKKKRKRRKKKSNNTSQEEDEIIPNISNQSDNINSTTREVKCDPPSSPITEEQKEENFNNNVTIDLKSTENNEVIDLSSVKSENPKYQLDLDGFMIVDEVLTEIELSSGSDDCEVLSGHTIESSESDIGNLEDVGQDMNLANCSGILARSSSDQNSTNCNVNYDYSRFDVLNIQRSQSDDPAHWKILPSDMFNLSGPKVHGPRCNRCRQLGHMAIRCPNNVEPPSCSLCGTPGHLEPRCPNKVCLQCGNIGGYSTSFCWKCIKFRNRRCKVCQLMGHDSDKCPDIWRRYHLTTKEGPLVVPKKPQLKPPEKQWCSGCAQLGHLEHTCKYYNRAYPPSDPFIHKYDELYGFTHRKEETRNVTNCASPHINNLIIQVPNNPHPTQINNLIIGVPPTPLLSMQNVGPISNDTCPSLHNNLSEHIPVYNPYSMIPNNQVHHVNNNITVQRELEIKFKNEDFRKSLHKQDFLNKKYYRILMYQPVQNIQQYLQHQISLLDVLAYNISNVIKKYFQFSRNLEPTRAAQFAASKCYREMNMIIFGKYRFKDGKRHLDFLKNFLMIHPNSNLTVKKRNDLFTAYNYIFGPYKHFGVNYNKYLRLIRERFQHDL